MSRRAPYDAFAVLVAETATVGLLLSCAMFWPAQLFGLCWGTVLLWSATWVFPKEGARAAAVLRNGLAVGLVPLPVLVLAVVRLEGFQPSSIEAVKVAALILCGLGFLAWWLVSAVRHSNEAQRRGQRGWTASWRLLALAPIPVLGLLALVFLYPPVLVEGVYLLLVLRLALGIATAIAWRPRSDRKNPESPAEHRNAGGSESSLGIEAS